MVPGSACLYGKRAKTGRLPRLRDGTRRPALAGGRPTLLSAAGGTRRRRSSTSGRSRGKRHWRLTCGTLSGWRPWAPSRAASPRFQQHSRGHHGPRRDGARGFAPGQRDARACAAGVEGGRAGAGIIDRILAFSRREEPERLPMRLRALCEEAVELLRASLPATVAMEFASKPRRRRWCSAIRPAPARGRQSVSRSGPAMEGRGALKLGLDAIEDRRRELALSHGVLASGSWLRLAVTDTGHGIDAATAERIFEPFSPPRVPAAAPASVSPRPTPSLPTTAAR